MLKDTLTFHLQCDGGTVGNGHRWRISECQLSKVFRSRFRFRPIFLDLTVLMICPTYPCEVDRVPLVVAPKVPGFLEARHVKSSSSPSVSVERKAQVTFSLDKCQYFKLFSVPLGLHLSGCPIKPSEAVEILGIYITDTLHCRRHIEQASARTPFYHGQRTIVEQITGAYRTSPHLQRSDRKSYFSNIFFQAARCKIEKWQVRYFYELKIKISYSEWRHKTILSKV